MKPVVALLIPEPTAGKILSAESRRRLAALAQVAEHAATQITPALAKDLLRDADACATSWGAPQLTAEFLDAAPRLRLIVHAAGSVKPIVSDAVWARGIQVTSGAYAIAVTVAEHTLGLMLSAMKRSYWLNDIAHRGGWRDEAECSKIVELYGVTIGIVGAGHVGRHVIKLLRNFEVEILLYDPFVTADEARGLGAVKVDQIDELMQRSHVVSLHAPNLPETHHLVNVRNLPLLRDGALLINTARGALIDEAALLAEAKTGRIMVCLDVTDPEPPAVDHPLRRLPNVVFTPHVAGTVTNGLGRLGALACTELERFFAGQPLLHPVRQQDLARLA